MIYLDNSTDSILPYGLKGTPFETVFKALQAAASTVWPVDAAELRAAIGWGWYLDNDIDKLVLLSSGKQYIQNILISEQVPLIKSTQTQEELVDLLYRWKSYKPTFDKLEDLYIPYAARVDVRPITDEATQEILPVTDIHNAFYVVLTDIDWSRPLTLGEAALIAERATPMGSRPIAVFQFEETTNAYPQLAYGDVNFYTGTSEPAAEPIPPEPEAQPYYMVVNETTGEVVYSISETEDNPSMVFSQVGHIEMPDSEMITVYETGVSVEEFWLGANGRSSTEDVTLQAGNKQYLRSEDGQIITDAGTIELYDLAPALAYIKADGNIYEAASGDYAFENERYPGSGEDLSLYTVNTGSTRSAWAALFKKKHGFAIFGVMSSTSSDDVEISLNEQFFGVMILDESPVPSEFTAYFTSQGAAATSDFTMTFGSYVLYDASGSIILSDDNHTYTFVKAYNYAGNEVTPPSAVYAPVFNNSGMLCLGMHPGEFIAYRLTYTVSGNT